MALDPRPPTLRSRVAFVVAVFATACSTRGSGETGVAHERARALLGPPLVSPDFALGAPLLGTRRDVGIFAVAAGPAGYLVLSERNVGVTHHELLGARILSDGTNADPQGVLVAAVDLAATTVGGAAAKWTGDRWLVAYGNSIWTFGADGEQGPSAPLGLSGYLAGVSWDGTQLLVVTRSGRGVFVNPAGLVVGDPFTIFPANAEGSSPVFDGTNHLVSYWTNNPATVRVASVGPSGPTGKTATLYAPASSRPSADWAGLAAGGGSALAQYSASPPSCALGGSCIPSVPYYQVLTSASDGSITLGTAPAVTTRTGMVFAAGSYMLLAAGGEVLSLTPAGAPIGSWQPLLAPVSAAFGTADGSSDFRLTASLDGSGFLASGTTRAGRLSSSLALLDDPLLAAISLPLTQATPAATFDGSNYLAAWQDSGRGGIAATRVSSTGVVLDSEPQLVASGAYGMPFAASSGDGSVLGWFTSNDLGLARVTKDLLVTPIDVSPLASPYITAAALASDGTDYLLGHSIPVIVSDPPAVRASLVSGSGTIGDRVDLDSREARVAATFDGQNYVLVWMAPSGDRIELRAARLTPSLVPVDVPYRTLLDFPGTNDLFPFISSDGAQSFVTWTQSTDGTIRVARVTRELELMDPGGIVVASGVAHTGSVVTTWDGARYWTVWQGPVASDGRHVQVLGRRYSPDAVALDDAPFLVTEDLVDSGFIPNQAIGLATDAAGGLLFTYQQDDVASHGFRVRGRVLGTALGGEGGGGGAATGGMGGVAVGGSGGVGGVTGEAGARGGFGGEPAGAAGEASSGAAGEPQSAGAGGTGAGRGGRTGMAGAGGAATTAGRDSGRGGATGGAGVGQAGEAGGDQAGEGGVGGSAGDGGSSAGRAAAGHAGSSQAGSGNAGRSGDGGNDPGCNCSVPSRASGAGWVLVLGVGLLRRRRGSTRAPAR
jgi:hypothetical protein